MSDPNISARIILPIVLIIIGLVILWRFYQPKFLDPVMLTGLAIVLVGVYGVWLESDVLAKLNE